MSPVHALPCPQSHPYMSWETSCFHGMNNFCHRLDPPKFHFPHQHEVVSWSLDSRTIMVASRGVSSEDLLTTLTVSLNENTQIIVKWTGNLCKYCQARVQSPNPSATKSLKKGKKGIWT